MDVGPDDAVADGDPVRHAGTERDDPARALLPGIPWAVAVALGAIVSPPDAVAAAAIVSRLPVPRRVIVLLEGESLVNDASALVLYRTAIAAAVTGVFSLGESIVRFFIDAGVGTAIGLLQALTQIQEQTLTFVPKLLAMGLVFALSLPMIGNAMSDFTLAISDRIVSG